MKVINTNNLLIDIERTLNLLDYISALIEANAVHQELLDIPVLSTRYYITLHDLLLPIAIKEFDYSVPKAYLMPIISVYIHEQKIYAILKTKKTTEYLKFYREIYQVPAIDLTLDEKLLILTSIAIAHKIILTPNERNILRIIPNNLKTYVETALKFFEGVDQEKMMRLSLDNTRSLNMIELILWLNNGRDKEDIIEIRYTRGVSMKIFRLVYYDHEIDIKTFTSISSKFVTKILALVPSNVLNLIINNIKNTCNILNIFKILYS
ncbi:MAG: hypothetical protein QW552_03150 [Ignisphaera sp.]|uniref:Uncharacterized protein n=1 Tax=Ignisphaera aggregans TaxID=334771 RepID=A0A7C4NLW2_9CREN